MKYDYLIVGAGFAGAVLAERLASQRNKKVLVVEKRNHIGGNAYDEYDEQGILIHRYGPHIFHTNSDEVFNYLSQFTGWIKYEHKVLAKSGEELYPIPINRITINNFYKLNLSTEAEAENFLNSKKENRHPVLNSEDIIVNQVGYDLFEKFFRHYTKKQWNLEPKELSSSVCGRIPVRFNEDCRYFTDKFQFMPDAGFTSMFKKMLDHKNIEVALNQDYKDLIPHLKFNHLIYTGPIDLYFDYLFGRLPYRSIWFEFKKLKQPELQKASVYNYVDSSVPYTRVTEYKLITGQISDFTTVSYEYTIENGDPFYPIPNENNRKLYLQYKKEADKLKSVTFCGRLAEYQYYNMDQVVASVLALLRKKIL
jgi:UDP-galactopyranose mutase